MLNPRGLVLVSMIAAAAATRLIPPLASPYMNLWNFTAIGAMCLFGGAYFRRKTVAFIVPMAALLLSDVVLAATLYGFRSFNAVSMSYLLFALTTLLGMTLRGRVTFLNVTAAAVVASAGFFSRLEFFPVGHRPVIPAYGRGPGCLLPCGNPLCSEYVAGEFVLQCRAFWWL